MALKIFEEGRRKYLYIGGGTLLGVLVIYFAYKYWSNGSSSSGGAPFYARYLPHSQKQDQSTSRRVDNGSRLQQLYNMVSPSSSAATTASK
jgi:hypothetical protein